MSRERTEKSLRHEISPPPVGPEAALDGAIIRSVCAAPPLDHEKQMMHLHRIRAATLAIREQVALFPGVLDLLAQKTFSGGELSDRAAIAAAFRETSQLWGAPREAGWPERYAERTKENARLALRALDEIFKISERPYADVIAIEAQVKSLCRGARSVGSSGDPEAQAHFAALALRPFTDILRSAAEIERLDHDVVPSRQVMVESNLRLVAGIVTKFFIKRPGGGFSGPGHLDLFQEGVFGLMAAIDRFKPELGYRFSTYATHWIRQAIGKNLGDSNLIAIPHHARELLMREREVRETMRKELGEEPIDDDVFARLKLNPKDKSNLIQARRLIQSSSQVSGDSEDYDIFATVVGDEPDLNARCHDAEETIRIESAINRLFEGKPLWIMQRRCMTGAEPLLPARDLTFRELGEGAGVSRERARQIESEALQVLTAYFIVEQAPVVRRNEMLARVLRPHERILIDNLFAPDFRAPQSLGAQNLALIKLSMAVVLAEAGAARFGESVQRAGLSKDEAALVGDRIFGPFSSWGGTISRLYAAGFFPGGPLEEKKVYKLFTSAAKALTPVVQTVWRRSQVDAD